MHNLKPYVIKGGGGGDSHVNVLCLGAYGPLEREREMGGGGGVRQTDGTEMMVVVVGGGRGSDSQKEGVDRQATESGT